MTADRGRSLEVFIKNTKMNVAKQINRIPPHAQAITLHQKTRNMNNKIKKHISWRQLVKGKGGSATEIS